MGLRNGADTPGFLVGELHPEGLFQGDDDLSHIEGVQTHLRKWLGPVGFLLVFAQPGASLAT